MVIILENKTKTLMKIIKLEKKGKEKGKRKIINLMRRRRMKTGISKEKIHPIKKKKKRKKRKRRIKKILRLK